MGKRIALFVVLFLGVVLLVRLVTRKADETVERAKPSRPAVEEKVEREVTTPERREQPRPGAREDAAEEGVEKDTPELTLEQKRQELARLKDLRDEYDEAYVEASKAKERRELEKIKEEDPERYKLGMLKLEDRDAWIEAVEAKRRERMERLRVEDPERYEGVLEQDELRKLRQIRDKYAKMYRELAEELGVEPE